MKKQENSIDKQRDIEKYKQRKTLSQEIDLMLEKKTNIYDSLKIMEHTPELLQAVGLEDLPILLSQNHLRNCMHEKGKNVHWHGLSKDFFLNLPELLENPAIIMDSYSSDDSVIVITDKVDSDKLPIMAIIRTNGIGSYELVNLKSNYLTSVYGKENFENFLQKNIDNDLILYTSKEKIQSLEEFSSLRLRRAYSSNFEFDKIIKQSENIVNTSEINIKSKEIYEIPSIEEISEAEPTIDYISSPTKDMDIER